MMKRALFLSLSLFAFAGIASAQQDGSINYSPVACFRGGELPLLQVQLKQAGSLRAYFRRVNTTDWCSVEGTNAGPLSRVALPKFEDGDELEYFFLLLDGKRVVAKSPQIYRVHVGAKCETPYARHNAMVVMDCSTKGVNSIPSSMGAGYALKSSNSPRKISDDQPILQSQH
jgi:hypothetical protein